MAPDMDISPSFTEDAPPMAMSDNITGTRRFFIESLPARAAEAVTLPPAEAHHAAHVLRLPAGAAVELFDGRGGLARGAISEIRRGAVQVMVNEVLPTVARPAPVVHLGFSEPKGKRLDWLLEKAAELGAASLTPVRFARSVAGREEMTASRRERWLAHCIAAAKQCGLNFLPQIHSLTALPGFLGAHGQDLCILGDPGPSARRLKDALADWRDGTEIRLLIGPEGGLTKEEQAGAIAAGFIPSRLGSTILRTETAAIAVLAATMALCGANRLP
jgi:16S rRNA (uracil1498-N3)-methyltransferase